MTKFDVQECSLQNPISLSSNSNLTSKIPLNNPHCLGDLSLSLDLVMGLRVDHEPEPEVESDLLEKPT